MFAQLQYKSFSMMGGMGLISVPNSCSIRYLQEVCIRNALILTALYIAAGDDNNAQHFVGKDRMITSWQKHFSTQQTNKHWCRGNVCLQVEAILVGDEVHGQPQMPKPARSAHLQTSKL